MAKPLVHIDADLRGVAGYTGAVAGVLDAIASPGFQGDFVDYSLKELRKHFMADTIAAGLAGNRRIQHVFEWPEQDQNGISTHEPSGIPLFKLKIAGKKQMKVLTFTLLPSTRSVPLPDPEEYGFKAEKLGHLRRHVFKMKALVMETGNSVTIAPKGEKKLFIPSRASDEGYFMTSKPTTINPGGEQATGGFTEWWAGWFEGVAPIHLKDATRRAEVVISRSGFKAIRHVAGTTIGGVKVGGRFATGQKVTMGYINAEKRFAKLVTKAEAKRAFNEDDEWDDE